MDMADPRYREILMSMLQSAQSAQPADYASSAPLSQNPTRDVVMGGMQAIKGIGQVGIGSTLPGIMGPIGYVAGPALMLHGAGESYDGVNKLYRGRQQQTGTHPDQAQMDEALRLSQYYGQTPQGMGRK